MQSFFQLKYIKRISYKYLRLKKGRFFSFTVLKIILFKMGDQMRYESPLPPYPTSSKFSAPHTQPYPSPHPPFQFPPTSGNAHPLGWTKLHQTARRPNRLDLPPDESANLEELESFSKMFKQKRIKLGYTQVNN